MRIAALLSLIAFWSIGEALAIKSASDIEIKLIKKQIAMAADLDQGLREAQQNAENAEARKDSAEASRWRGILLQRKDRQTAIRAKAIHMTILAYDLRDFRTAGDSVSPMTKGRRISWIPVAMEAESRDVQDVKGNPTHLRQPGPDAVGITYPDGVTYIPVEAFKWGGWVFGFHAIARTCSFRAGYDSRQRRQMEPG